MKRVLFVPGHTEDIDSRGYRDVIRAIKKQGYAVEFVPINWRYTYIDKWVAELEDVYKSYNSKDVILAGFSFGAITAFVAAANKNPSAMWLFSLSPYFAEDMPKLKNSWKNSIGVRKINALNKLVFSNLASEISCPTLLFMGTEEARDYPPSRNRVEEALKLLNNSKLVYVNGAGHDVSDKRYISAITNEI